jgi:hypothetical protein
LKCCEHLPTVQLLSLVFLGMLRFTYFGLGVEQVDSVHSSLDDQLSIFFNYMRLR